MTEIPRDIHVFEIDSLSEINSLVSDAWFKSICDIIQEFSKWSFPENIYGCLSQGGCFEVPGIYPHKRAVLIRSIHIALDGRAALDGGRHFLKFHDGKNVFYLIIHYSPIAIYMPAERIFICLYKIYNSTPDQLVRKLEEWEAPEPILPEKSSGRWRFGGVIASSDRPFHYFFEILYALSYLYQKKGISGDLQLYCVSGAYFFAYCEFLGLLENTKLLDSVTELNAIAVRKDALFLPAFVPLGYAKSSNLARINANLSPIDDELVVHSEKLVLSEGPIQDIFRIISGGRPVLWFSLCSEKRVWFEQNQALVTIINSIAEEYNDTVVIIDGMTAPLNEKYIRARDPSRRDLEALNEIRSGVRSTVKFISLFNQPAFLKIAVASRIDFFMTHHMTDSLFVARFARKPGVTHQSAKGSSIAAPQYRHEDSIAIPIKHIADEIGASEKGVADISYSIDPVFASSFFLEHFHRCYVNG